MDSTVTTYLLYLGLSVPLTVWVGRTLYRNGGMFLVDVFKGDESLASAVNHLLVVGFYLLNLGYVSLALKLSHPVANTQESIEALSLKVGLVSVVLGVVHLSNVFVLNAFRKRATAPANPFDQRAATQQQVWSAPQA
jgi:hypothetical protein